MKEFPVRSLLFVLLLVAGGAAAPAAPLKTENVFLIISDGFRWQEVFAGAEEALMTKEAGGVKNTNALQQAFWRATPEARREVLLPFFWREIAQRGQLLGNQPKRSVVAVTNGKKFSYPGYNEILTGRADPRIDSNAKTNNPNINVFEWLQTRKGLQGRAAIFGTWNVFPYIFNCARSRLPIWPGWESKFAELTIPASAALEGMLKDTTPIWEDVILDAFVFHAVIDHVKARKPRLVFIGFGETDEWAHAGRYDLYLAAAQHFDGFVRRLWETVQGMQQYRGKTTFVITADHGRGVGPDWKNHSEKTEGAEGIWVATLGPDTPPLGERSETAAFTQSQIAATIAAFLGEDYRRAFPQAAAAIPDLIGSSGSKSTRTPGVGARE